jgi:hypothetical protein
MAQAARSFRDRVRALAQTAAIRSRAHAELNRLRYARLELLERRGGLMGELGEAVYAANAEATERVREKIARLDERVAATEAQMRELATEAEERIRQTELPVQETEIVEEIPERR